MQNSAAVVLPCNKIITAVNNDSIRPEETHSVGAKSFNLV